MRRICILFFCISIVSSIYGEKSPTYTSVGLSFDKLERDFDYDGAEFEADIQGVSFGNNFILSNEDNILFGLNYALSFAFGKAEFTTQSYYPTSNGYNTTSNTFSAGITGFGLGLGLEVGYQLIDKHSNNGLLLLVGYGFDNTKWTAEVDKHEVSEDIFTHGANARIGIVLSPILLSIGYSQIYGFGFGIGWGSY